MFWELDFLVLISFMGFLCGFLKNMYLKWGISSTFTVALLIFKTIM